MQNGEDWIWNMERVQMVSNNSLPFFSTRLIDKNVENWILTLFHANIEKEEEKGRNSWMYQMWKTSKKEKKRKRLSDRHAERNDFKQKGEFCFLQKSKRENEKRK